MGIKGPLRQYPQATTQAKLAASLPGGISDREISAALDRVRYLDIPSEDTAECGFA